MSTAAFCENDEACRAVLKKHWPTTPIIKDVKNVHGSMDNAFLNFPEYSMLKENIDIVCGGFPCQDISVAGQKKGIKGERSGLWGEFKRVIKEVEPRYVIIENVANLRNLGLQDVLKDLWSIGYASEWHIISARSIGACHLRERVWIIAYPNGQRLEGRGVERQQEMGQKIETSASINDSTDSDSDRCHGKEISISTRHKKKSVYTSRSGIKSPNTDMPRLWQPFASEKEKSEWWTEATSSFRDWWKVESEFCRMDDGLPKGLDKIRKERIKQLGNSLLPQIPELIGKAIIGFEENF